MYITLAILLLAAGCFVSGRIRSDFVAICSLVLLLVFQILTPEEALSGFSNSVVIMMIGLFIVGGGIFQTGLAKMISSKILKLAGKSELRLFILIILTTAGIGAFVSNTGTVALMLPIVVSLAASAKINQSKLLMPLAFASSMGILTLIATPPNLIIQDVLTGAGYKPLSFFSFFPVGVICIITGTILLIPLSRLFLDKHGKDSHKKRKNKSLHELSQEYQLSTNLFRIKVTKDSTITKKKIGDLNIRNLYGITIFEVRGISPQGRLVKTVDQKIATPDTIINIDDILYVLGDFNKVQKFAADCNLQLLNDIQEENSEESLAFYNIGIAEILLMNTSGLIDLPIKNSGFREKFNVNILGIRRKNEYILHHLKDIKMHNGDILLVQGTWNDIARLGNESSDWVVLGQPLSEAARVTLDYKAPLAALIMALMVVMMVVDSIPVAPVTSVLIAAILMIVTGCIRNMESAYKTINGESIVLIAAMMPMSIALQKTGASEYLSNMLVSGLGNYDPIFLLAGIYFTTSLMTMFISNTATAVLLAPIALQSAIQTGVSPYAFLFAVAVGASMCFASPFSTPPNALVMAPGQYTFMDYIKVGLPLQIIVGIVMIFTLPLLFPF